MDEPNVLLANVPAFGDAEKFKESGARLAKLWSKPASIPFARKKVSGNGEVVHIIWSQWTEENEV